MIMKHISHSSLLLEASFFMLCLFLSLPQTMRRTKKSLEFHPDHPGLLTGVSFASVTVFCPLPFFVGPAIYSLLSDGIPLLGQAEAWDPSGSH